MNISKSQQKMMEMNIKLENEFRKGQAKGFKEGMLQSSEIIFYMTAYVLTNYEKEKIYMSRNKIQEIMRRIFKNIDEYRTKQLSPEDYDVIKAEVINDYGIQLK